ncbi:MAG: YidC/Oxa1 family rane protein insertase [Clostridiales bacterium]|nr:YidC/Oxa1 family rane protein insertase [Clostridiales bacterium]
MLLAVLTKYDGVILGPIAVVLGWILNGIYAFLSSFGIENAGLCIIIFTFFVNALMIPMTMKQQKFTKLSAKMNPELVKIQEKYKGKRDEESLRKSQLETQAVYEKYGASPTSGCLPMLITFPILFALYRVIYNIPAYVSGIQDFYNNVAVAIQGVNGYVPVMTDYADQFSRTLHISKWGDISQSIPVNHLIDILVQFKTSNWTEIASNPTFASISDVIATNSARIMHINNFAFGLNIAETPMGQMTASTTSLLIKACYLSVPVLSVVTQMIQTKLMTRNTPQVSGNDTTAATMKSMNTIMPFFSGFICLTLPVGLGIYWIAGALFRIIQQLVIDRHLDKMDVDALIEANREKQKKKRERKGISESSMEEYAKKRTNSLRDFANTNSKNAASSDQASSVDNVHQQGSISGYANMLSKSKKEREEK